MQYRPRRPGGFKPGGYRPKRRSGGYRPRRPGGTRPRRPGGYRPRRRPGGGGGCYIATASLANQAFLYLDNLRDYRDDFLESFGLGRRLVSYYRNSAPEIANFIKERPFLAKTFLFPFVLPSVKLTKNLDKNNPILGLVKKSILFIIFLLLLLWAWILDKVFKINKS